jgi:hypothetical protein
VILVIGQVPTRENARDGMVQRIAAVDALLAGEERVYLAPRHDPLSVAPFELEAPGTGVRAGRPNLFNRGDVERMVGLARQARAVYVHSVHWAQHVLPLYLLGHVVTDLHGVVPEEQRMVGQGEEALQLERVERFVLEHGLATVVVSDAMAVHLRAKYPGTAARLLELPNLSRLPAPALLDKPAPGPARVLYAGGTHAWQKVPRMLEALQRQPGGCEVEFLTPDVERLRQDVQAAGLEGRLSVRSVAPAEMPAEYARAHFGFVLRDDHVVNRVACPTKLQEYLAHGVLPIVESRSLGDFEALGYRTVAVEQFERGALPLGDEWREAVLQNRGVYEALRERTVAGERELSELLEGRRPPGATRPGVEEAALLPLSRTLDQLNPLRAALVRSPRELAARFARKLGL